LDTRSCRVLRLPSKAAGDGPNHPAQSRTGGGCWQSIGRIHRTRPGGRPRAWQPSARAWRIGAGGLTLTVALQSTSRDHGARSCRSDCRDNRHADGGAACWLQRGLDQPGGKLPLFDRNGQRISHRTIKACLEHGWAEPWFANPLKPDWLVCKLTPEGRRAVGGR